MQRLFKRNLYHNVWAAIIPSRYGSYFPYKYPQVVILCDCVQCYENRAPDGFPPRSENDNRHKSCFDRPAFSFAHGTHCYLERAFRTPESWRRMYIRLLCLNLLFLKHSTNVLAGIYFSAMAFGMLSLIDTMLTQER